MKKQSQGQLRDVNGFCCLGVMCDVKAKEGIGKWDNPKFLAVYGYSGYYIHKDNWDKGDLPRSIKAILGLPEDQAIHLEYWGNLCDITNLNDSKKLTFAQIADLIEAQL